MYTWTSAYDWKEEVPRLAIITAVVLAILATGVVCYTYVNSLGLAGYHQAYAYSLFALSCGLASITAFLYMTKALSSKPTNTSEQSTAIGPDISAPSLEQAIEYNENIVWAMEKVNTAKIKEIKLKEVPATNWSLHQLEEETNQSMRQLLDLFEQYQSPLLKFQLSNGTWRIVARVCNQSSNEVSDGVILIFQSNEQDPSEWSVKYKIHGRKKLIFDQKFYGSSPPQLYELPRILAGESPQSDWVRPWNSVFPWQPSRTSIDKFQDMVLPLSFEKSIERNKYIKWLMQDIENKSILELSQNEVKRVNEELYRPMMNLEPLLELFIRYRSRFMTWQDDDKTWCIAARIKYAVTNQNPEDGVLIIAEHLNAGWIVKCNIGLNVSTSIFIKFIKATDPEKVRTTLKPIKNILNNHPTRFDSEHYPGTISLWC